jgi:hypothetical protein
MIPLTPPEHEDANEEISTELGLKQLQESIRRVFRNF